MTSNLKSLLQYFAGFTPQELDEILKYFKPKSFRKNETLLQEGSVCREFYYIVKGCIRTFFIDKNGRDKTRYIILDNQVGTTLTSFISQKPSFEIVEALEDTEVLAISHENFYRLNQEMDHWKMFYQKILERSYAFQNRKIEALLTLSAKQRYETIMKKYPQLIQRVSNKVLASYLDMREETLSRLKSS